ncbi:MAG: glycosyltransferase family 2 protein [Solirubrobacteraceae bacterium]
MGAPRLVVAIATYNGREMLEIVLPSLCQQTFRDFRVVVVDDASSDGTVEWLAERWPQVEVVAHSRNRGVSASLNSCLRAGPSEFVALLNNDIELDPDCLGELIVALTEHPEAGAACGKLLNYSRRELLDGAGDAYTWGGSARRRGKGSSDTGQYDKPQEVFSVCAAAAVYRRAALDAVGLFDERFFFNYEDIDWCFRAQLAGWSCRYVPSAVAYHVSSATLGSAATEFKLYHNWRNQIWVVAKNYPAGALVRHAPELAYTQMRNLVLAVRIRRPFLWLRVWRDVLAALPAILADRHRIQRSRARTSAELDRLIGADR